MDINIRHKKDTEFVDKVILEVSPIESLSILKALRVASKSPEIHPLDQISMDKIIKDWKDFTDSYEWKE